MDLRVRGRGKRKHRDRESGQSVVGKKAGSAWDEELFGEYLRLLKARGKKLPKLRKKPRKEARWQ
jgi:hypothetical protein